MDKDKMDKTKRSGSKQVAYFTDDGFAIGLAYILAILKQDAQFESLHWFDSIKEKLSLDASEIAASQAASKKKGRSRMDSDVDTISELRLKTKRVEDARQEFDLLFFSLSGAQVFFKDRQRK